LSGQSNTEHPQGYAPEEVHGCCLLLAVYDLLEQQNIAEAKCNRANRELKSMSNWRSAVHNPITAFY